MTRLANTFVTAIYVVDQYAHHPVEKTVKLASILKEHYANYEVIVIDNGLSVDDLSRLRQVLQTVPCIRVIRLSKNHDTDTAVFAGIEASIGDYVCVLYDNDPEHLVPEFVSLATQSDIIFGVATNLNRQTKGEQLGASIFYWYSKKYLGINVPKNSTYYICMNRSAANALTRSGRSMRHVRHMALRVGFTSTVYEYELPKDAQPYSHARAVTLLSRAVDLTANYSSHPLQMLSYFGIIAGILNILYAVYVLIVNFSRDDVAKGWTTLSLQSSLMFFILFMILAVLSEYIGKILSETQQEPPYHIMQELSSTISIADETRRNVTK